MPTAAQRQVISDTFKDRLSPSVVDSVEVQDAIDSDGDPILKITVILKKGAQLRDSKAMVGLARNIREKIEDSRFPLIDFLSASDAARRSRETT